MIPDGQAYELQMQTASAGANQIKMPEQGTFQLKLIAGDSFAVLDSDATDGEAKIQVPAEVWDIYLQPEQNTQSALCEIPNTTVSVLDQMDQLVQAKAQALIAAGQGACTYLPSVQQRQNANCNSTANGLNCSGALNKNISFDSVYFLSYNLENVMIFTFI